MFKNYAEKQPNFASHKMARPVLQTDFVQMKIVQSENNLKNEVDCLEEQNNNGFKVYYRRLLRKTKVLNNLLLTSRKLNRVDTLQAYSYYN